MNPIDAALMPGVYTPEERRALAQTLKQQEAIGALGRMSQVPGLAENAATQETGARALAKTLGESQYTRQRDLKSDEEAALERKNRLLEKSLGGSSKRYGKPELMGDIPVVFDYQLGAYVNTETKQPLTQEEIAAAKQRELDVKTQAEIKKKAEIAKLKRLGAEEASNAAMGETLDLNIQTMDNMINGLQSGGMSGPIADVLPTVRNPSIQVKNAKQNLTLDSLSKYKLYPLSDKDIKVVAEASVPNFNAMGGGDSEMLRWAEHKKQSLQIMKDIQEHWAQYSQMAAEQGKTLDQAPELMEEAKRGAEAIRGDFDFAFKLGGEQSGRNRNAAPAEPAEPAASEPPSGGWSIRPLD